MSVTLGSQSPGLGAVALPGLSGKAGLDPDPLNILLFANQRVIGEIGGIGTGQTKVLGSESPGPEPQALTFLFFPCPLWVWLSCLGWGERRARAT